MTSDLPVIISPEQVPPRMVQLARRARFRYPDGSLHAAAYEAALILTETAALLEANGMTDAAAWLRAGA